jgi:hypothetical protein
MRTTRSAFAIWAAVAAASIGTHVSSALADNPPKLNVGTSCAAAARGAVSIGRDKEACMSDERAAQETLAKNWPRYSAPHKTQCVGMTTQGGPSYVELISCLEIMRDAAEIKKNDPFVGTTGDKRARSRSSQSMRRSQR